MAAVATYTLVHGAPMTPSFDSAVWGGKANSMVFASIVGGSYVTGGIPCDMSTDLSHAVAGWPSKNPSSTKRAEFVVAGTSLVGSGVKIKVLSGTTEMAAGVTVPSFLFCLIGSGPMASSLT